MTVRPPAAPVFVGLLLSGLIIGLTAVTVWRPAAGRAGPPALRQALVIGHRGAPTLAPENTLASLEAAHRLGVRWVEGDVQRTRDHRLVVLHDATLARTTDAAALYPGRAPWRLRDFTLAQVERLDAGRWFGRRFAGQRVPTLDAYLRRLDRYRQGFLLELKNPGDYPGLAGDVAARLRADGWLDAAHLRDRLMVQSFDPAALRAFHRDCPRARTGLLGNPSVARLTGAAERAGRGGAAARTGYAGYLDSVNPDATGLTGRYLAAARAVRGDHGRPIALYPWTVDDPARAVALVRQGAAGVISDRPALVRAALDRAAGARPPRPAGPTAVPSGGRAA